MQNVTEFNDAICGECLDLVVNADPHNMGWTSKQYDEWIDKFDRYCDDEGEDFIVSPADGPLEMDGYLSHSGCPICADGLACKVYPVTFTRF